MENKQKQKENEQFEESGNTGIIKNPEADTFYDIVDRNILMNQNIIEFVIKNKKVDSLALYNFYCYCSKLQRNTRNVYATNNYVMKNLGWNKQRLLDAKRFLSENNIIRSVVLRKTINSGGRKREVADKWLVEIVPIMNAQNIEKISIGSLGVLLSRPTECSRKEILQGVQNTSDLNTKTESFKDSSRGTNLQGVQEPYHNSIEVNNNKFYRNKNTYISDSTINDHINKKQKEDDIQRIFEEYTKKILPGSRLTSKSKDKIKTRLKEFSVGDILTGIDNFSKDDWWITNNAHRGIAWFFHSEDRTEQFKNLVPRNKRPEKEKLRLSKYQS